MTRSASQGFWPWAAAVGATTSSANSATRRLRSMRAILSRTVKSPAAYNSGMRRTMAVLLAAGLLAAAGCGDDDDEPSGGEQSTGAVETGTEPADTGAEAPAEGTRVVLTEFAIDPANPTAKAGA